MTTFNQPPIYTSVTIVDKATGMTMLDPIWSRWFLDIASLLKNVSTPSSVQSSDDMSQLLANRAFQQSPSIPDITKTVSDVMFNKTFSRVPTSLDITDIMYHKLFSKVVPERPLLVDDTQSILAGKVFRK